MADRERIPLEYQPQLSEEEYETEVPPEDEAYSLEEILEEYGGGLERKLSAGAQTPEAAEGAERKKRNRLRSGLASLMEWIGRKKPPENAPDTVPEEPGRPDTEERPHPSEPERIYRNEPAEPVRAYRDEPAEPVRAYRDEPAEPVRAYRDEPAEPVRASPENGTEHADGEPDGKRQVSFSQRLHEAAERTAGIRNALGRVLGQLAGLLSRGAAAVRRGLGAVRLPALPKGTRIPVLSALGDRIEAARRKRRPKRNRGQPVPIPGRRRKGKEKAAQTPGQVQASDTEQTADAESPTERGEPKEPEQAEVREKPDAPEPSGTETDSAEPSGTEADSAEPSGTEADSAEPSGTEADSAEPSGTETDSAEPSGTEADSAEPSSTEADSTEPSGEAADSAEPSGTEADSAEPPDTDADAQEPYNAETDAPEPPHREPEPPEASAAEKNTQKARRTRPLFQRLASFLARRRKGADEAPIGPEIPLHDAAARFREAYTRRQVPPLALLAGGLPTLLLLLEWAGVRVPLWSGAVPFRCLLTLLCVAATAYLCRQVFTGSVTAFACGVSAAAAVCDCLVRMVSAARSPGDCFGTVACLALIVAQWGVSLESRGRFDAFRAASLDDEPPCLVTDMAQGACKQRGATPGFYSTAMRPDLSTTWQSVLLPLTLTVSLVFAGISSFGRDRPFDFFLNWSAILAAGATFTLSLCWGLPWASLARRLQKSGGAVAGWAGAEKIARQKNMIVTDTDLFPPGAVQLNGIRLFGGDMDVAVSYAAAMVREASCGLERPFDELLHTELGEGAEAPEAEEFNFYEEGGYGAAIHGSPVLMGTAAFLRRMGVLLPHDLHVPGGMFLAVDHRLLAVFAIRYNAADNVDYALRMMRRSGVTPLLAVRDPNITPAMLQRRFRRKIPVKYPDLAGRIALSEVEFDRDAPRALLFREGLLPYAETVVGCRRLCGGVRRATLLSEFGSLAGMLLTFYLCYQGKYELLTPLSLTVFLLLWLLPALLVMELF